MALRRARGYAERALRRAARGAALPPPQGAAAATTALRRRAPAVTPCKPRAVLLARPGSELSLPRYVCCRQAPRRELSTLPTSGCCFRRRGCARVRGRLLLARPGACSPPSFPMSAEAGARALPPPCLPAAVEAAAPRLLRALPPPACLPAAVEAVAPRLLRALPPACLPACCSRSGCAAVTTSPPSPACLPACCSCCAAVTLRVVVCWLCAGWAGPCVASAASTRWVLVFAASADGRRDRVVRWVCFRFFPPAR
jgi:hypothetical protein